MAFPHRLVLHRPVMRHDERLGHVFVPSVRVRICHERGSYILRTNSQGFRSNAEFTAKGSRPRIVIYGDSFAAGDGVANEERFSDLLAGTFDAEVINLAISGTAPDQNVMLAETDPEPARHADIVLWCIAAHTLDRLRLRHRTTFNAEGRLTRVARPYFDWEQGELVARGIPVPDVREVLPAANAAELDLGGGRALLAARGLLQAGMLEPLRALVRSVMGPPHDPRFRRLDSESWRMMVALTARFRAAIGDVPLVIVPLPNKQHLERRLRASYRDRFVTLADPAVPKGAEKDERELAGTTVLDVYPAIAVSSRGARRQLCFPFDGHYTPLGHQRIAAAIAQHGLPGLEAKAPVQGEVAGPPVSRGEHRLDVEWDHAGSRARLIRVSDGAVIAAEDEATVAGRLGMLGAVPWTAINVCLDQAQVDDADLSRVVLRSPAELSAVRGGPRDAAEWAAWAAPWVRWFGAAEMDVRRQLAFAGQVDFEEGASGRAQDVLVPAAEGGREATWLLGELRRRRAAIQRDASLRTVWRLASRWERATRRARYASLPFPAPRTRRASPKVRT